MGSKFSILITTFNRLEELKITLIALKPYLQQGTKIIICDDASTDGTSKFLKKTYPEIKLLANLENKGLIYSRNLLMSQVKTPYAISLDDDANFLSENPLVDILTYFEQNSRCAVISFRIFWGLSFPVSIESSKKAKAVKSFVGCGHVWRMAAWKEIPDYPDWYEMYGEENFASLHLFKKGWEVHYLPSVLVHHRVDNKARKLNKDFYKRQYKSLRADWFNFLIFYPRSVYLRKITYSIIKQVQNKLVKGNFSVIKIIIKTLLDLFVQFKKIKNYRAPLSQYQLIKWFQLSDPIIYWTENDGNK